MKTILYLVAVIALFVLAALISDSVVEGFGPRRQDPFITDPTCDSPPQYLVDLFYKDINRDPVFRAGTVPLFSSEYVGHGSIVSQDGELFFITVEHVADIAQGSCAYFYFPGTDFVALVRYSKFNFSSNGRSKKDEIAGLHINGELLDKILPRINDGSIIPLVVNKTMPSIGETVVIPDADTGVNTRYVVDDVNRDYITLVTNGQGGVICGGRSGGPVLLISNGLVTNQIIGVITSINTGAMYETPQGNHCGYIAYAIPF